LKLLVVIVNFRTADLAIECLRSIEADVRSMLSTKVVVVDNKSPDDSVATLRTAIETNGWAGWCELQPLDHNGGFAFGNNEGIRPRLDSNDKPELVLLLNPDMVSRPGAIPTLLRYMEEHPDVGIAGSRTEWPDGSPQTSAFRFPTIAGEIESALRLGVVTKLLKKKVIAPPPPAHEETVDWVVGASMMVRREVFEEIGLLDAKYFMYFEEVDFCLRAKRAGFVCRYVPEARIVHFIGKASGVTDSATQNRRRPAYWFDSRRRYFVINHGLVYAALADLAFAIGFAFWRVRRAIQRKPDPDPVHFLGDFLRHSVFAKGRA
jgi:N-acetylglucosaminyl-diphospho-decaprenol L-rhamnosyltransferase